MKDQINKPNTIIVDADGENPIIFFICWIKIGISIIFNKKINGIKQMNKEYNKNRKLFLSFVRLKYPIKIDSGNKGS